MKKNHAKMFAAICDLLPDECGRGTINMRVYGEPGENYIVFQSVLMCVSRDNLHDTVEAVAKYLDEVLPGYRCLEQARKYRQQDWNYPALWCDKVIVEWNA